MSSNGKSPSPHKPMIHELVVGRNLASRPKEKKMKIPNLKLKKVQRQRPTNDSFRQAVDRSYQSIPGAEVGESPIIL